MINTCDNEEGVVQVAQNIRQLIEQDYSGEN